MKDLITAMASIFLLSVFILQFAGNQAMHVRVFQSGLAVETFRDEIRSDGQSVQAAVKNLQQSLAEICGCSPEEIAAETGESEDMIYYEVSFPLQNLIVMGSALGIGPEENRVMMKEKGWIVKKHEKSDSNTGADSPDEYGDSP